jgi:hypothetical protein
MSVPFGVISMENKIHIDPEEEPRLYDRMSNASQTLADISDAEISGAEKTLDEIVGPRGARFVRAEWSLVQVSGPSGPRRMALLRLTDPLFSETREETFQPVELRNPALMKTRLLHVWREFLQHLSHKQMDRLHETVRTLEGD